MRNLRMREISVRYSRTEKPVQRFSNSWQVFDAFADMKELPVEVFRVVVLSAKNMMVAWEDVARGGLDSLIANPRDVLWYSVHERAHGVIFLHNHPSGESTPSEEDRVITERLFGACKLLGIRCVDHIIIGDGDFFSFADAGLLGSPSGTAAL